MSEINIFDIKTKEEFVENYQYLDANLILQYFNDLFKTPCGQDRGTTHDMLYNGNPSNAIKDFLKNEIQIVKDEGGGEGGGEYCFQVIHFKSKDVYLGINGTYYSYDGHYWPDPYYQVFPKEVTVTEYVTR